MEFKNVASILLFICCILQNNFALETALISTNHNPVGGVKSYSKIVNDIETYENSAPVGIKSINKTDSPDKYLCGSRATTVRPSFSIGLDYMNWKFSDGWFEYFKNGTDIPTGIDYTNDTKYEVGFPVGFQPEKFLNESVGIWMTVHDSCPPIYDQPTPYINLTQPGAQYQELGSVEIKCYLHENSSLVLTFDNLEIDPFIFENTNNSSKTGWDIFNATANAPFQEMQIRIITESNSSFVIIANLTLTDWIAPVPTTTSTTAATGNETTTADVIKITTTTPQLRPTTEDIETNNGTKKLMNYFQFTFPFIIVIVSLSNLV